MDSILSFSNSIKTMCRCRLHPFLDILSCSVSLLLLMVAVPSGLTQEWNVCVLFSVCRPVVLSIYSRFMFVLFKFIFFHFHCHWMLDGWYGYGMRPRTRKSNWGYRKLKMRTDTNDKTLSSWVRLGCLEFEILLWHIMNMKEFWY